MLPAIRRGRQRTAASRPRIEQLEGRDVPATLIGLTTADTLVTFDSSDPGTAATPVAILRLLPTEDVVGIDVRPATGQLYGVVVNSVAVGNNARLVIIDPASGAVTTVGTGETFTLDGGNFGVDFDPVSGSLRTVSDSGQSLRINPASGAIAGSDTAPFFDSTNDVDNGFTNPSFFDTNADGDFDPGTNPPTMPTNEEIAAIAYTMDTDVGTGLTVTTLYGIDSANDLLVRIGGAGGTNPDGTSNSPNIGQTYAVDNLRGPSFMTVDFSPQNGFDIDPVSGMGYAVTTAGTTSTVYSVNVASAAVTSLGTVGGGLALRGLAVAGPTIGAGTIQLSDTAFTFPADRSKPLAVTVTRTGGSTGTVTVNYATADGSAVGGRDYLPVSGTVTFAPGQTSQQIFLSRPSTATPGPAPERTFTLTLSNAMSGATLGGNTSATITIPAVAANTTSGRRFVAGEASGQSQVAVYDSVSGTLAFAFTPFANFTGGVRVAAGDVNGDGIDDVIVAAGPGGSSRVTVFDGSSLSSSNQTRLADFFAYETAFSGGTYVASGDVNGDGFDDIIIGAGLGGGPRVRVLDGSGLAAGSQTVIADFFAYESTFRGGVFVASGNFNGDGFDDIVAGASVGGGPRVQIFDGASIIPAGSGTGIGSGSGGFSAGSIASATPTVLANYFAYDPSFRNGVFVAAGDVNADGIEDVVTGPGFGGGPDIRSFSGISNTQIGGFFAFDQGLRQGAPVATADIDADGRDEILVGFGVGDTSGGSSDSDNSANGGGGIRIFDFAGNIAHDPLQPFGTFSGGVFVG